MMLVVGMVELEGGKRGEGRRKRKGSGVMI